MNVNTSAWPVQEGNLQPRPCSDTLTALLVPVTTLYHCCCFRNKTLCGPGGRRTAVRCLQPFPAFLLCGLDKEQVGTVLPSATPQLSEPASKLEQGGAERWCGGSAILWITGFWGSSLPRLSQLDKPLACRNLAGFTEIKSI